ncbi:MAG: HAMP domain-containing histidine kinase [Candidatus Gastranaerophilales bacterium]|nr:HAMP domain-containing histidine kinase [Candidatus Gastranaerophilales bacterium]
MKTKNFNTYFETQDLTIPETYSFPIVKSIIRSILEPIASNNCIGVIFTHLNDIEGIEGIIKRLEYSKNIILRPVSDFEFSKFNVENIGFVVLTTKRYNCAFLFKEIEKDRYQIYLKLNSKLVSNVYETIKSIFLLNYDKEFYEYKPERRENDLMNDAVCNIIKHFEENIKDNIYNSKIQESYKTVNETNTTFRNEIYQNVKQIAHEIKNQLSILDIYTRIFEKKTQDFEIVEPIKKSIGLIKSQLEAFKNFDVVNLQEHDVKLIIQDCIKTYSHILKEKNNKIIFIDEMPEITANAFVDEEKFAIVVNNIIKNAHDCTQNDEILIKLKLYDEKINISFINHGQKIEADIKEDIFEKGYTTKSEGWGVGLAVCKRFIGSQFGTIELEKSDENETIFTLSLPLVQTK